MTLSDFHLIKAWVRAEAKAIASEMVGHHPATVEKRFTKARDAEQAAMAAFEVVE